MEGLGAYHYEIAELEAAAAAAGGIAAIPNPEGVDLIVTRVVVDRIGVSDGAATVDVGIAANATTLSDNLLDGLDINAAAGVADNITDKGTNGKSRQVWGASQYLTVSKASGSTGAEIGFAGHVLVEYLRRPS